MDVGISGYGVYIPRYRIASGEYMKAVGSFARMVGEKAVAAYDEDAITMGVEAAANALKRAKIDPGQVDALYFASTSPPYSEKLISGTASTAIGLSPRVWVADLGFSTKAGTSALLACIDFVSSGRGDHGLVIASDCPMGRVGYPAEQGLGAGAAAFVIGKDDVVAAFEGSCSAVEEVLGERFRRYGERFVEDLGIGPHSEAAFYRLVTSTLNGLMNKLGIKPEDVNYTVVHQSDIRAAYRAGGKCGFTDTQVAPGIVASKIGDSGASSVLIGLIAILEKARPGERAFVASYGSGAGSDAISFLIKDMAERKRGGTPVLEEYLADKEYLDFVSYLKIRRMIST